jgi:hypothetical protein
MLFEGVLGSLCSSPVRELFYTNVFGLGAGCDYGLPCVTASYAPLTKINLNNMGNRVSQLGS